MNKDSKVNQVRKRRASIKIDEVIKDDENSPTMAQEELEMTKLLEHNIQIECTNDTKEENATRLNTSDNKPGLNIEQSTQREREKASEKETPIIGPDEIIILEKKPKPQVFEHIRDPRLRKRAKKDCSGLVKTINNLTGHLNLGKDEPSLVDQSIVFSITIRPECGTNMQVCYATFGHSQRIVEVLKEQCNQNDEPDYEIVLWLPKIKKDILLKVFAWLGQCNLWVEKYGEQPYETYKHVVDEWTNDFLNQHKSSFYALGKAVSYLNIDYLKKQLLNAWKDWVRNRNYDEVYLGIED